MAETEWGYNISEYDYSHWQETDMYLEEFVEWYEETKMELLDDSKTRVSEVMNTSRPFRQNNRYCTMCSSSSSSSSDLFVHYDIRRIRRV